MKRANCDVIETLSNVARVLSPNNLKSVKGKTALGFITLVAAFGGHARADTVNNYDRHHPQELRGLGAQASETPRLGPNNELLVGIMTAEVAVAGYVLGLIGVSGAEFLIEDRRRRPEQQSPAEINLTAI